MMVMAYYRSLRARIFRVNAGKIEKICHRRDCMGKELLQFKSNISTIVIGIVFLVICYLLSQASFLRFWPRITNGLYRKS